MAEDVVGPVESEASVAHDESVVSVSSTIVAADVSLNFQLISMRFFSSLFLIIPLALSAYQVTSIAGGASRGSVDLEPEVRTS